MTSHNGIMSVYSGYCINNVGWHTDKSQMN